jgi:hypothetical protein
VKRLLEINPHDSAGHRQLAHLLDERGDVQRAEAEFETAANCNPNAVDNYLCHGKMAFRCAGNDVDRLKKSRELLQIAVERSGGAQQKAVAPYFAEIERRLEKAGGTS